MSPRRAELLQQPAGRSSTSPGSWGTSVEQIDCTYGHLLPDLEEYLRGLLDAYDVAGQAA